VSDFGLTKFRDDIKKGSPDEGAGTVHWTAPEVLSETGDADFVLADVYSFGTFVATLVRAAVGGSQHWPHTRFLFGWAVQVSSCGSCTRADSPTLA
jgi:serine/threonine protein kinase